MDWYLATWLSNYLACLHYLEILDVSRSTSFEPGLSDNPRDSLFVDLSFSMPH
jgi:hypothetical protein